MKARPYITERLLMGRKESNKKKMFFQVLTILVKSIVFYLLH